MTSYMDKITLHFESLPPLLKKVAEHLLNQPIQFAQESASKIAIEIGVSETTVIRFSTAIGYKGFSDLQRNVRNNLYSSTHSINLRNTNLNQPYDFIQSLLNTEVKQITDTMKQINPEDFQKAIERIVHADRILIAGSYNSYSMAHWLSYNLGLFTNKVQLFHPGTDNIGVHLHQLGENSLLFTCSFYRYALETIWLAEEAKKKGVFTISVTDSPIAPIRKFSDLVFQVVTYSENSFETSPASAYSILHSIVIGAERWFKEKGEHVPEDSDFRLRKFFV